VTNPYAIDSPELDAALKAKGDAARRRVEADAGSGLEGALAAMQRAGVAGSGSTGAAMRGVAADQAERMGDVEAGLQGQELTGRMSLMDALNAAKERRNKNALDIYGIDSDVYGQYRDDRRAAMKGAGQVAGKIAGKLTGLG